MNTPAIEQAKLEDIEELARLFDLYRQFYEQPADLALALGFMRDNLEQQHSSVYVARDGSGTMLGFVQLYPGWCSVAAAPICVLYDLFVDSTARQGGVGRALMQRAEEHARASGACRIDLETAHDNHIGQALYEDLGYERETHFYKYSLEL